MIRPPNSAARRVSDGSTGREILRCHRKSCTLYVYERLPPWPGLRLVLVGSNNVMTTLDLRSNELDALYEVIADMDAPLVVLGEDASTGHERAGE